jgi:transcriptional regulator with PAS, ATPase and Fis domain
LVAEKKTLRDANDAVAPQEPGNLGAQLFRLLCADDLSQPSRRYALSRFAEVAIGRAQDGNARPGRAMLRIGLPDLYASTRHAHLESPGGSWHVRDDGSTNGTWLNGVRIPKAERQPLHEGDLLEVGHTFFLFRASARGAPEIDEAVSAEAPDPLTLQPEWALELAKLDGLARTSHEILLLGESGAGKEVLAQLLHERSGRARMVILNCGALPENLLEDELFGHARGAFSGAHSDRQGLIRAADGGALFLDEVGDMPPALQVKLLRFLEDHKVRSIGSEKEDVVDVRVIAATHRNLEQLVAQGKFRHDLMARLGLLPIRIPALRERREDLGLLIRAIVRTSAAGLARVRFTPDALRLVLQYSWPLNVRELRHALLAAVDLARAEGGEAVTIAPRLLPVAVRELRPSPASQPDAGPGALTDAQRETRDRLVELLRRLNGNVTAVAREMGKARMQIQRWIVRYGIDVRALRSRKQ